MFTYFWVFRGFERNLGNFGTLILIRKWRDFACFSARRVQVVRNYGKLYSKFLLGTSTVTRTTVRIRLRNDLSHFMFGLKDSLSLERANGKDQINLAAKIYFVTLLDILRVDRYVHFNGPIFVYEIY